MRKKWALLPLGLMAWCVPSFGDEPTNQPRPLPLTRTEMKELIEQMKQRKPRIPLPELTAEEKEKLGERGGSYESRLRSLYMDNVEAGFGGGARGNTNPARGRGDATGSAAPMGPMANPDQTLDNTFKVQLFWIVSRANNCQYCQGHQESKLLRAGQTEDQIAALDGDWSVFGEKERVAFAFGQKFTVRPHELNDADIAGLKKHFTDAQILEMMLSMAGNNAINRWKEGVGVPQSENGGGFGGNREAEAAQTKHTYLTPTSPKYKDFQTTVAPVVFDAAGKPTRATVCKRPDLEPRAKVEAMLQETAKRTARLPLAKDAEARAIAGLGEKDPLPNWVKLMALLPITGKTRIANQMNVEKNGDLTPLLKARVSWVVARQDRAWYATGIARQQLRSLGQTDDQIFQLDGNWQELSDKDRAMLTVAKKLAASPVVLTDDEVSLAVKLCGPREVVQLVNFVTTRASFNRITEAAGLPLDGN